MRLFQRVNRTVVSPCLFLGGVHRASGFEPHKKWVNPYCSMRLIYCCTFPTKTSSKEVFPAPDEPIIARIRPELTAPLIPLRMCFTPGLPPNMAALAFDTSTLKWMSRNFRHTCRSVSGSKLRNEKDPSYRRGEGCTPFH